MNEEMRNDVVQHIRKNWKKDVLQHMRQEFLDAHRWRTQKVAGKREWLKIVPSTSPIEPHRFYRAKEVAAILNVSYDTARRRMRKMGGKGTGGIGRTA
jgi:hypothetical protein